MRSPATAASLWSPTTFPSADPPRLRCSSRWIARFRGRARLRRAELRGAARRSRALRPEQRQSRQIESLADEAAQIRLFRARADLRIEFGDIPERSSNIAAELVHLFGRGGDQCIDQLALDF